jgi:hypothetical protein
MRRIVCVLAVALTACWGQASRDDPKPTASATVTPTPTATASAVAVASSNGARSVSEETDDFLFEYSYPKEAGRIPELSALLDRRLEKTRADLAVESAAARNEARDDGFPYNKHSTTIAWKVISDLPDWLSLSGEVSSYSGGAHGNYGYDSLVWDKRGKRAFEAIQLFQSPAALDAALGSRLCQALDKERAKRRGEPVPKDSSDEFDQCVGVKEATVLVGSRSRRKFDRVGVQIGPYVAGPYAEGSYEFTFPVDGKILAAVKPEFREAFAARK